jgi:hypothetical protein
LPDSGLYVVPDTGVESLWGQGCLEAPQVWKIHPRKEGGHPLQVFLPFKAIRGALPLHPLQTPLWGNLQQK